MKPKYQLVYGVLCRDITVIDKNTAMDTEFVRIRYKIKGGRKFYTCWVFASEIVQ